MPQPPGATSGLPHSAKRACVAIAHCGLSADAVWLNSLWEPGPNPGHFAASLRPCVGASGPVSQSQTGVGGGE
jgi:hypothetical protein